MVDMFQELRVKMFLVKPTEKPVTNLAQDISIEELMNLLTLNTNLFSKQNSFNMPINNMKLLLKLSECKDNKIPIRKYVFYF